MATPVLRAQTSPASPPGEVVQLDRLVVTTATRTERLLSDVPVRTEVVLREDMNLRVPLNFSQAVELLNGVRVESNCQNCNTSEVQLLGLGGAYNQILFDGTPLLSSLGGVYGLEQIPTAFVDRLEVVKGGGSALYGPGAVAGVINLVPIEPRTNGGFLQVGVDVQKNEPVLFAGGRANLVLADGKLGFSLVGHSSVNDGIDYNDDGYTEITEKELGVGGFQLWFAPTNRTKFRANYQFTWENRRGGNRLNQPEFLANIAESLQTKYHRGGVVWDQVVNPDFDFRLGYSFAYIERKSFYGGLGDVITDPSDPAYDPDQLDPNVPGSAAESSYGQYGYTENPLHYWDSQFNYRLGAHVLAFGAQYKRESVLDQNRDFAGALRRTTADDTFSNTGVYVQDEWAVSPALDLVLGGRIDKSSTLENPILSPRIAAAWSATETLKLQAGVTTGFRAPEVFSEDLHVDTLGAEQVRIRNAAGLSEEQAVTTMIGLEWRSAAAGARWAFDATASLTDIKDTFVLGEIQTDPVDGSLFQERGNSSGSRIAGFESNVAFEPNRALRFTAGLAYYQSRYDQAEMIFDDTSDDGTTVIATRDYLKTPKWSGVVQSVWTPNEAFEAFVGLKYTGRMNALNNNTGTLNRTPDFWVVDLGLTRHFRFSGRHLDFSVGVKNLFDERQRDLEVGASRDSDYVYGPRFARSFYGTLKYEF
ncbi:TonB-dependent receptor [Termitidicoccus mucosus]|uniref:TonB-dependent receptor n=1 Tax=Termitidicoccus mucosus TaxID=1184151 RepID=A0A178IL14_9BACT|nr:TonB-dependent receptor [Opitutaceae bacterium TSB47]